MKQGSVYLVGAGPGDAGLLTLKGKEALEQADVVIYDRLVNVKLLNLAPPAAELIYVGKSPERHTLRQDEINALLVEKARAGLRVVRLKGGDPFVFGRGGEEIQTLAEAGIPYRVVPGITSAIAAPAYAGIPLTHRHFTSSVAFITGNEEPGKEDSSIAWDKLATGAGTLVFLMGVQNLPRIATELVRHGRSLQTPVAVIYRGTTPEQRVVEGTLADIADRVAAAGITNPATIIVGEVAGLREKLAWAERQELFGRRVLVTRARHQASILTRELEALGAEAVEVPVIKFTAPGDAYAAVDRAMEQIATYAWLIFTSANGVDFFFRRFLAEKQRDIRELGTARLAAIGPQTAACLRRLGLRVDCQAREYRAEGLFEELARFGVEGRKLLLARAEVAREVLPDSLRSLGATVDEVPVYRTLPAAENAPALRELLAIHRIDAVTFTSSSTAYNFAALAGGDVKELMRGVAAVSIGPVTSQALKDIGLAPTVEASEYTIPGLVRALVNYFQGM
ncbi:MAG: uroporphyrinogen-III C-methyltransferase [Clostridia bacterium]|nr:MAG: uroporphyrinogen-III C-methyltransferase [Clostridia bacterium]